MDELDAGSKANMPVTLVVAQSRRAEGEHRPQPLAAGGNQVPRKLRDQRHRALHMLDDGLVDPFQISLDQIGQTID